MIADAIVVGGGPAGSTAAWRLARAGARVVVLDAATFPRVKLCAGWVTPRVWAALGLEPASYPHTLQPFARATLELAETAEETRWPATVSYGIVRREFDHFLLERARAAGAEVREGARVTAVERERGCVRVATADGPVRAGFVIGAGGHHCPVARALGEIGEDEAVVVTQESETRIGCDRLAAFAPRPGVPELFAEPDFRGYGWYFSKGDFLNVGIGALDDGRGLKRRTERFIERLRESGRLPGDLPLTPMRGHAYAVHVGAPRKPAGERFLLAGDAAGLARGVSGEGIGPAVESARLAAEALLASPADEVAARYREALAVRFGDGRRGFVARLAATLPDALTEAAAAWVCRNAFLRRRLLFEGAFGMEVPS